MQMLAIHWSGSSYFTISQPITSSAADVNSVSTIMSGLSICTNFLEDIAICDEWTPSSQIENIY